MRHVAPRSFEMLESSLCFVYTRGMPTLAPLLLPPLPVVLRTSALYKRHFHPLQYQQLHKHLLHLLHSSSHLQQLNSSVSTSTTVEVQFDSTIRQNGSTRIWSFWVCCRSTLECRQLVIGRSIRNCPFAVRPFPQCECERQPRCGRHCQLLSGVFRAIAHSVDVIL
jgi:hypothetical protein